jgi:3-oxoacyl-[acyl-carrier-protein] synthase III
MIGIKSIASAFPEVLLPAGEIPGRELLKEQELEYFNGVGIDTVPVTTDLNGYPLAKAAAEKLLNQSNITGEELDLIILIQCRLPEYFMSSSSTRLQQDLQAKKALVLSISDLGCADMSMALKLAKDFLVANRQAENVLICYGNTPYSNSRYRFPVTIYGDAGIAVLVGRTEENKIVDVDIRTDGKYWDLFKVEYRDRKFEDYREECTSLRKYGFELAIESKMRFSAINSDILQRNGLGREDVRHYILQNISNRAYEFYETAFNVTLSPVCRYNLRRYGHLGPADIMLNYQAGMDKGLFQRGDKVLIMNNSPVAAWSAVIIEV